MKSEFKELSKLKEFDARNSYFGNVDENGFHALTLEVFYNNIAAIKLNKAVPEKIVTQFDVAKNLAVYSCFVYRFHEPAKMHAYSTLEFALKDILGAKNKGSLRKMIKSSIELGLITKNGFTNYSNTDDFLKTLPKSISFFRNHSAHGSSALSNDSRRVLVLCSNLINELYKNKELVKIAKVKPIKKPQKNTKEKWKWKN